MEGTFLELSLKSAAALAVVLALFALFVWAIRRLQGGVPLQHKGNTKIVHRLALDSKHSLVEVEFGNESHLIAISPSGVTLISRRLLDTTTSSE